MCPQATAPLDAGQLQQLKARLLDLASQLGTHEAGLRVRLAEPPSDSSNAFIAGAEAGLIAEAQDEVIAQIHHDDLLLDEVQEALNRLAQGAYGQCSDCGEDIGVDRLQAVPWTVHCLGCQNRAEQLRPRPHA
jgi:DnaK suppressor protein